MSVNPDYIRYLQRTLPNAGPVDGIAGSQTMAAVDAAGYIPLHWSKSRRIVGTAQAILSAAGGQPGTIDGYDGPQTQEAFLQVTQEDAYEGRPDPELPKSASVWPTADPVELTQMYGPPGTNLGRATCPYPLRIAWNRKHIVRSFVCHMAIKPAAERAMGKVLDHYGLGGIKNLGLDLFGGCYNERPVRGGSRPSAHSWALPIDWDPTHNGLRTRAPKARLSRPEYDPWHACWEEEGFLNLGKVKGYDWMHHRFAG